MTTVEYKSFINGKWVASVTGKTFEDRNPADTLELVGTFQKSDKRGVGKADAAAAKAFKFWRLVPAPKRAEIIFGHRQRPSRGRPGRPDVFSEWKALTVDFSGTLQKAQIDT
jgi:hypothetical protein